MGRLRKLISFSVAKVFLIRKSNHSTTPQQQQQKKSQPETKLIFHMIFEKQAILTHTYQKPGFNRLPQSKTRRLLISMHLYQFPASVSLRMWDRGQSPQQITLFENQYSWFCWHIYEFRIQWKVILILFWSICARRQIFRNIKNQLFYSNRETAVLIRIQ